MTRYVIVDTKNHQIWNGRKGVFQDQLFAQPSCIYSSRTKGGRGRARHTVPSERAETTHNRLGNEFLGGEVREVQLMEIEYLRTYYAEQFAGFLGRH